MKTINVKRAYEKAAKSDGFRILVDRLWPRGLKKENAAIDLWLKDIAPSTKLRQWFNHDPQKWQEFQRQYALELKNKTEIIDLILTHAKKKNVTLIFGSKEIEHNNATALQKILIKVSQKLNE